MYSFIILFSARTSAISHTFYACIQHCRCCCSCGQYYTLPFQKCSLLECIRGSLSFQNHFQLPHNLPRKMIFNHYLKTISGQSPTMLWQTAMTLQLVARFRISKMWFSARVEKALISIWYKKFLELPTRTLTKWKVRQESHGHPLVGNIQSTLTKWGT